MGRFTPKKEPDWIARAAQLNDIVTSAQAAVIELKATRDAETDPAKIDKLNDRIAHFERGIPDTQAKIVQLQRSKQRFEAFKTKMNNKPKHRGNR